MTGSPAPGTNNRRRDAERLVLVGTGGAGKTTLAKRVSERLEIPHIEFDGIRHGPNWTETPDDVFKETLSHRLKDERWVADGNYSFARDIVWPRATTVVWLDYPIRVVMWRLFWRTMRRGVLRQELWNGNRDRLWWHFFSRQSLFLWAMRKHWRRRRTIPAALGHPEHAHLELVRLRSPKAAHRWLLAVTQ